MRQHTAAARINNAPPCGALFFQAASEAESFLSVTERRIKTYPIETQGTAIARAMASICNDEWVGFEVLSGHDPKTLSL